jgi:ketosteroid isomerase-like protein
MSQENVANLRTLLEAWSRERWTSEALREGAVLDMSLLDPHVVYEDENLPDHVGEAYTGHEGVARATRRWLEPFEWLMIELERIVEADDCVVSIHRTRAKARQSGIEFEGPLAYVWVFRGGKVIHVQSFREPEKALEAAGLRE